MRDGHPGARGRERGCGAARSAGRPYSGPAALKQLVSLPGVVAKGWPDGVHSWGRAGSWKQTGRGVGLSGEGSWRWKGGSRQLW